MTVLSSIFQSIRNADLLLTGGKTFVGNRWNGVHPSIGFNTAAG